MKTKEQEKEGKTAIEILSEAHNVLPQYLKLHIGHGIVDRSIEAMEAYTAIKSKRIAELEARVAELEGVLNTKREARFTELVNYEINWAKSEISNLPKVNDGTQKAFFDGFILGCAKIKQRALKELATNALKNEQP